MTVRSDNEAPPASTPSAGLGADVLGLAQELRELAHDQLQLATLETRRYIKSLLITMIIGVVTSLLLVSTWLGIVAVLVLALVGIGLGPMEALVLVTAANLFVAAACWTLVRHRLDGLGWPRTLGTLGREPDPNPEGGST